MFTHCYKNKTNDQFIDFIKKIDSRYYIDLDNGRLKGKQIDKVTWGSHAADIANILLQRQFRIAVHAREIVKVIDQ